MVNRQSILVIALLLVAPAAHAQQWLVNSAINNQIVETAICDDSLRKHEKLPDVCAKYPKYAGAMGASNPASAPPVVTANTAALTFRPAAGNDVLRKFADGLGKNPEERQQFLQIVTASKASFEQQYAARGWKNHVAGAYAYFIGSIGYVWSGVEPDAATQGRLFDALSSTLAASPDLANASDQQKSELYDTLIVCASLPLLFYVDGTQQNNTAEIEQARAMATEYSRRIMQSEPSQLAATLQPATGGSTR